MAPLETTLPPRTVTNAAVEQLLHEVVQPFLTRPGAKVSAVRLSWFHKDPAYLEGVWAQIAQLNN